MQFKVLSESEPAGGAVNANIKVYTIGTSTYNYELAVPNSVVLDVGEYYSVNKLSFFNMDGERNTKRPGFYAESNPVHIKRDMYLPEENLAITTTCKLRKGKKCVMKSVTRGNTQVDFIPFTLFLTNVHGMLFAVLGVAHDKVARQIKEMPDGTAMKASLSLRPCKCGSNNEIKVNAIASIIEDSI